MVLGIRGRPWNASCTEWGMTVWNVLITLASLAEACLCLGMVHFYRFLLNFPALGQVNHLFSSAVSPPSVSVQTLWISPFCWCHAFRIGESSLAFSTWIFLSFLPNVSSYFYLLLAIYFMVLHQCLSVSREVTEGSGRVPSKKCFSVVSYIYLTLSEPCLYSAFIRSFLLLLFCVGI